MEKFLKEWGSGQKRSWIMVGYDNYKVLLGNIVELLKFHFGEDFLSCALFGSVARNEALPESDIDLLIVHRSCDYRPTEKFLKVLRDLEEDKEYKRLKKHGYLPDPYPVFLDEAELEENPLILLDVLDHGVILSDLDSVLDKRLFSFKKDFGSWERKKALFRTAHIIGI
ncbi:MAG: nucleotidyltransferase domain-containing protein [bacterium]